MSLLNSNLEAFIAITKTCTVQGAAKELGITQTGVTQRLRSLESKLATTLFIRSRRGMMLTHEGHALLRYCQMARSLEGEALSKIQKGGIQSEVRISISGPTSISISRIMPQLLPVMFRFPELLLNFEISDLENRIDNLKRGAIQFVIVDHKFVTLEMDSKILKPEKYILVGTRQWKHRTLKDIIQKERIIDFDFTDQTSYRYLQKFDLEKEMRPERHFINNNEALLQMFISGVGYGVLTLEVARPYLENGVLIDLNKGAALESPIALAWYPRFEMPRYFSDIIDAIR